MSFARYFFLCLLTVLLQATLSTQLSAKGMYPDLCLVLACVVGFVSQEYKGLMVGLTVGLFQDILAPGGIGLNMILKGLAGALAGMTTQTISTVTVPVVLMVTCALSFGCGLASLMVAYPVLDGSAFLQAISAVLLPQSVYNGVLAVGIFWLNKTAWHSWNVRKFEQRPR